MSLEEYQKKKEAEKDKITLGQPREAKEEKKVERELESGNKIENTSKTVETLEGWWLWKEKFSHQLCCLFPFSCYVIGSVH